MKWWNNALIYQIYIRSFNKNINGIRNKIPYLKKLNIDAIWINPFFKDGGKDGGYDVIDYYNINEEFGNLKDIKNMISDLHNNNIKLIIDLPLNHTSNKNQWFIDSENRNNNKDNWYIWKKEHELPKYWKSVFEISPWTYSSKRDEYYYHYFYKEQPDLNFENSDVKKNILNIVNFWINLGVDGIRFDAVSNYVSDPKFRENEYMLDKQLNTDQTMEFINSISKNIKQKTKDIFLIGEQDPYYTDIIHEKKLMLGLDKLMNFKFAYNNFFDPYVFMTILKKNKDMIYFLNNHDVQRNRYGEDNPEIAKIMATLLMIQNNTKIIYYGQEIGMFNGKDYQIDKVGRDVARSPMQWFNNIDDYKVDFNWIPVNIDNIEIRNVEDQEIDPYSIMNWYINLSKLSKILIDNIYDIKVDNCILSCKRKSIDNQVYTFYMNFEDKIKDLNLQNIILQTSSKIRVGKIQGYETIITVS